jgi:NAD(P)-dependent dehydrogenase (short-subunit alcohol dehydrogenase family)
MTDSRVVVITGAGGEIGKALCERFAREHAHVVLIDRTQEAAKESEQLARASGATDVLVLAADQTSRMAIEAAFDTIATRFARIDVLVANAGFARFGGFLEMSPKLWELHVNINLNGTFHTCQAAAKLMVASRQGGVIIVTSSCLALFHSDQNGAYCATKAALLMLVRTMAAELGVHRIRANAVLPGVIDTGMTHTMLEEPNCRERLLNETPVGRIGTAEDVAGATYFLASMDAAFITGASLLVDGGQSIYNQPRWYSQSRKIPHDPSWTPMWGGLI